MVDLNKKEAKLVYNHINKFLKYFETTPGEETFWKDLYNIEELKSIRDKLKNA
tara:strand:+ start:99 stop:257 length:159 start_codon:yes stop_codon:yes gene_type:complete